MPLDHHDWKKREQRETKRQILLAKSQEAQAKEFIIPERLIWQPGFKTALFCCLMLSTIYCAAGEEEVPARPPKTKTKTNAIDSGLSHIKAVKTYSNTTQEYSATCPAHYPTVSRATPKILKPEQMAKVSTKPIAKSQGKIPQFSPIFDREKLLEWVKNSFPLSIKNREVVLEWIESNDFISDELNHRLLPIELWSKAASQGNIEILNLLNAHFRLMETESSANPWQSAIQNSKISSLDWLKKHNFPGRQALAYNEKGLGWNLWFLAAANGQIESLDWLLANQIEGADVMDKTGRNLCFCACMSKKPIEILNWLQKHKISDPGFILQLEKRKYGLWDYMIQEKSMLVLGWLKDNNVRLTGHEWLTAIATPEVTVEVLDWLHENQIPGHTAVTGPDGTGTNIWHIAVQMGQVNKLNWLKQHFLEGATHLSEDATIWHRAILYEQDQVLDWLYQNKISTHHQKFDFDIFSTNHQDYSFHGYLAGMGKIKALNWYEKNILNHVYPLQIGMDLWGYAAYGGQFEFLEQLKIRNVPGGSREYITRALSYLPPIAHKEKLLKWLENNFPDPLVSAINSAIKKPIDLVQDHPFALGFVVGIGTLFACKKRSIPETKDAPVRHEPKSRTHRKHHIHQAKQSEARGQSTDSQSSVVTAADAGPVSSSPAPGDEKSSSLSLTPSSLDDLLKQRDQIKNQTCAMLQQIKDHCEGYRGQKNLPKIYVKWLEKDIAKTIKEISTMGLNKKSGSSAEENYHQCSQIINLLKKEYDRFLADYQKLQDTKIQTHDKKFEKKNAVEAKLQQKRDKKEKEKIKPIPALTKRPAPAKKSSAPRKHVSKIKQTDRGAPSAPSMSPVQGKKFLNAALEGLQNLKLVYAEYITSSESKSAPDPSEKNITHYCLFYFIFRIMQALKQYNEHQRSPDAKQDEKEIPILRNMMAHHGAIEVAFETVLETAKELGDKLGRELLSINRQYQTASVFSDAQLTTFVQVCKIADDPNRLMISPFRLVLEDIPLFNVLEAFHANLQQKKDPISNQEALAKINHHLIPLIKRLMDRVKKAYPDALSISDEKMCQKYYFREIQALKVLLTSCGEYYHYIKSLKPADLKNTLHLVEYKIFLGRCFEIRGKVHHEFPDCFVGEIFSAYEMLTKIKTFPFIPVEEKREEPSKKEAVVSEVTSSAGDEKESVSALKQIVRRGFITFVPQQESQSIGAEHLGSAPTLFLRA